MTVDLTELRRQPAAQLDLQLRFDAARRADEEDWQFPRPLDFEGQLTHVDEGRYRLEGRLRGEAQTGCARCLASLTHTLDLPVEVSFMPAAELALAAPEDEGTADTTPPDDDDEEMAYPYQGNRLDVGDALWTTLWLALPTQSLCRRDCLGLCPYCGADRNERDCACQPEEAGPRSPFADLGRLLEQ